MRRHLIHSPPMIFALLVLAVDSAAVLVRFGAGLRRVLRSALGGYRWKCPGTCR